jgi:hypothetical protein
MPGKRILPEGVAQHGCSQGATVADQPQHRQALDPCRVCAYTRSVVVHDEVSHARPIIMLSITRHTYNMTWPR